MRTNSEEVFDALMLNSPTLSGLREAVSIKHIPESSDLSFLRWGSKAPSPVYFCIHWNICTIPFGQKWISYFFHQIMLTVFSFLYFPQISEKYGLQKETIGKIYKKCRRGWASCSFVMTIALWFYKLPKTTEIIGGTKKLSFPIQTFFEELTIVKVNGCLGPPTFPRLLIPYLSPCDISDRLLCCRQMDRLVSLTKCTCRHDLHWFWAYFVVLILSSLKQALVDKPGG